MTTANWIIQIISHGVGPIQAQAHLERRWRYFMLYFNKIKVHYSVKKISMACADEWLMNLAQILAQQVAHILLHPDPWPDYQTNKQTRRNIIKSIFLYNIRKFNHLFESHEHLVLQHTTTTLHLFSPSVRTLISFSLYVCITFLCISPTTRWHHPIFRLFLPVLSFVFCFQYFWIEVLILLPSRGWFSFQVHFFNQLARWNENHQFLETSSILMTS